MRSECWALRRWFLKSGLGLTLLGLAACGTALDYEAQAKRKAYQERYAKAKALFEERCKTAGVVIHRTVKDVEGIELTKIRPEIPWGGREYFDPMFPGAAMAGEASGLAYIRQFLWSEFRYTYAPERRGELAPPTERPGPQQLPPTDGYRFVEVIDGPDARRLRYRLAPPGQGSHQNGYMQGEPVQQAGARYALDYKDLVDPADRALWVAGTKLRIIDKQTGEVLAELTRFVWDPGFGVSTTGRWPWQHASMRGDQQCPVDLLQPTGKISRYFIDTVLIPKQGD